MDFVKEMILGREEFFLECHASSVLQTGENDFLVTWFAGTKEGQKNVAIWFAKRTEEGWGHPEVLVKLGYQIHWNPVLFRMPNDDIALFFKVGKDIKNWQSMVMYTSDNGDSWSEPQELVPGDKSGGRGTVKNKPINLSNGDIIAPASIETIPWTSFADISSDAGKTWTRSQVVEMDDMDLEDENGGGKLGLIQPTLWESSPGKVHMFMRSNNCRIYRSDSDDFGRTWSKAYPIDLPNNNSGIDLVKLPDDRIALVYNHITENWGARRNLTLAISDDNGRSWKDKRIIEHTPVERINGRKIEYSYPAIISHNDRLTITYTYNRRNIAFISGTVDEFLNNLL